MSKELKENSAIQTHINILQNIITRMATNSSNCKTWAITITAAIIVLLIDSSHNDYLHISFIPLLIFYILDSFYLGLERHFKELYHQFIKGLEENKFDYNVVYKIKGPSNICQKIRNTVGGLWSFSTMPIYLITAILILIIIKI